MMLDHGWMDERVIVKRRDLENISERKRTHAHERECVGYPRKILAQSPEKIEMEDINEALGSRGQVK